VNISPVAPAPRASRIKLTERQLQQQIADLLALDSWRRIRTEAGQVQAVVEQIRHAIKLWSVGHPASRALCYHVTSVIDRIMDRFARSGRALEKGMADDLYLRYFRDTSQHLWIECKIRSGKYTQEQITWAEEERARGGLVWQASTRNFSGNFVPTIEGFLSLYRESGLMRRELSLSGLSSAHPAARGDRAVTTPGT
jgi:hypothetical protein